MEIKPVSWKPRSYQEPIIQAVRNGIKRAVLVWHRRSGKDKAMLNLTIEQMGKRVGTYFYFFPSLRQGKKALWKNIDRDGMPYLDHFPREMIAAKSEVDMSITMTNGSVFQIIGTDNLDAAIGTNPVGCIFSEYSLQNPLAWNLMRPILRENDGFALFNYTPRGKNHAYDLFEMAKKESDWFHQLLTIRDTFRDDGSPVVTAEDVEKDCQEGMDRDLAEQEYFCSFEGFTQGSIFGELMRKVRDEGRICRVPYEPKLPVITAWDIGVDDNTSIWWLQVAPGGEIRAIDYHEEHGKGLDHYSAVIKGKGWPYDYHCFPHDVEVREFAGAVSRKQTAISLGLSPIRTAPAWPIEEGTAAIRRILPRIWFDEEKCRQGLECLKSYHREYDEERKVFLSTPCHDWSSHGVSALKSFAISFSEFQKKSESHKPKPPMATGWAYRSRAGRGR